MVGVTQALIDAVITKIKAEVTDLAVEQFPDRPDDYRLNHPVGAVLVLTPRSRYVPAGTGVRTRTLDLVVRLALRNFASRAIEYDRQDQLRYALHGWIPGENWQALAITEERFVAENAGIWQFDLMFEVKNLVITQYNPCL
jgi:hypothetical protein